MRSRGQPESRGKRSVARSSSPATSARSRVQRSSAAMRKFRPRVGHPLKPMLAQSANDVADAFAKMPGGQIALEYKLDGARVQIHKRGDEIKIFSRHLTDLTGSVPEVVDPARRELRARDAIVEGEVIALTADGRPRPFQDLMRRVGRERDVSEMQREVPVRLYLFDCLYR